MNSCPPQAHACAKFMFKDWLHGSMHLHANTQNNDITKTDNTLTGRIITE